MIQLVTRYGLALVFANVLVEQLGLPVPAIPTLIVFTLCQNVIMRGIVVPVEK